MTTRPVTVRLSALVAASLSAAALGPVGAGPTDVPGHHAMRGVCYCSWQREDVLASRWSDEKLADVKALGADWVAVRVTWVQDAYNSTRIQPGFPTQSDEAYAHAVKRCHALGMKVMLALIVDFKDPMRGGSYRWRGQINPDEGVNGRRGEGVKGGRDEGVNGGRGEGVKGGRDEGVNGGRGEGVKDAAAPTPLPDPPGLDTPWGKWMASYERFAGYYAKLAQEWDVDMLCVGAEMTSATNRFDKGWRRIIAKVRENYKGPVTYQANWSPLECAFMGLRGADLLRKNEWNAEYKTVKFWDALDCAGLCAYFSLSEKPSPTQEELDANLAVWREDVRAWQKSIGKPVIFSEVGYQSADGAATEPWRTPLGTPANPDLQARCYEAFLKGFSNEPWVQGIFWWMVCPPDEPGVDTGGKGYPFLGKPAVEVLRRWWR